MTDSLALAFFAPARCDGNSRENVSALLPTATHAASWPHSRAANRCGSAVCLAVDEHTSTHTIRGLDVTMSCTRRDFVEKPKVLFFICKVGDVVSTTSFGLMKRAHGARKPLAKSTSRLQCAMRKTDWICMTAPIFDRKSRSALRWRTFDWILMVLYLKRRWVSY